MILALPNDFNLTKLTEAFNPGYGDTKYDHSYSGSAYGDYCDNHHPQAIHLIKTYLTKSINTSTKWLDILHASTYHSERFGILFNYILVAVYPRTIKPEYPKKNNSHYMIDYDYITWETSQRDIDKQSEQGVKPDVYLIVPQLVPARGNLTVRFNISDGGWYNVPSPLNSGMRHVKTKYTYKGKLPDARIFVAKDIVEIKDDLTVAHLIENCKMIDNQLRRRTIKISTCSDIIGKIETIIASKKPIKGYSLKHIKT